jgi:hypothetical protein
MVVTLPTGSIVLLRKERKARAGTGGKQNEKKPRDLGCMI